MRQYPVAYGNRTAKAQRKHRRNSGSIFVAPRYLVWVNFNLVLCSFLWAASTDRPDHWPSVASSVVPGDSTKNEPQRHKVTKISFHVSYESSY